MCCFLCKVEFTRLAPGRKEVWSIDQKMEVWIGRFGFCGSPVSQSKPLAGQALAFLRRCHTACVLVNGKQVLRVEENALE